MKSSSGQHFVGLDHLRGLAAFLVVLWHFGHGLGQSMLPAGHAPEVGLIDEGHSGVALFMTLSGYLFAKLIGDHQLDFRNFLRNRAARLLPMLVVALTAEALINQRENLGWFLSQIAAGILRPSMPNGGWSIVVEAHFYVLLPALLILTRRWPWMPLAIVAAMTMLRGCALLSGVDMEFWSYATLLGRLDQFVIGMAFARVSPGRFSIPLIALLWLSYAWFSAVGGYYGDGLDAAWVVLPVIEGLGFGALISWYSTRPLQGPAARLLELAGKYSYSIYLLHFFAVEQAASFVNDEIMELNSVYQTLPFAILFFLGMMVVGHIAHRLVEAPFLRRRRPYLIPAEQARQAESSGGARSRFQVQGQPIGDVPTAKADYA